MSEEKNKETPFEENLDKGLKLEFMPGCFDDFEGTQEELDELVAELERMAKDGTFLENSEPLSDEEAEALEEILGIKEENRKVQ